MKLLSLIALFLALDSLACDYQTSSSEVRQIIDRVKESYFPELMQAKISIREFSSDEYFLQAKPEIKSLLKKKSKRSYFVEVNTNLYKCSPSALALEAIIAHELEHIADYEKMTSAQIMKLGASYASGKFRARYERATDMKVVDKGMTEGLIQYREWIYKKLNPSQLKTKRKLYLTPEELQTAPL
jgi:hypothetical protein